MTMKRVRLHCTDIRIIKACGRHAAQSEMTWARDALGKTASQFLTIQEYCQLRGLCYTELSHHLPEKPYYHKEVDAIQAQPLPKMVEGGRSL